MLKTFTDSLLLVFLFSIHKDIDLKCSQLSERFSYTQVCVLLKPPNYATTCTSVRQWSCKQNPSWQRLIWIHQLTSWTPLMRIFQKVGCTCISMWTFWRVWYFTFTIYGVITINWAVSKCSWNTCTSRFSMHVNIFCSSVVLSVCFYTW